MSDPITMNSYAPVEWIDEPNTVDLSFLEEVPLVPDMTLQAIIEPLLRNEVDELFGFIPPQTWANFFPFKSVGMKIRRLFKRKVLDSFDVELAIETLDNLHESGTATDTIEGEKLYGMLYELTTLNDLLEEIILNLLSSLKP